MTEQLAISKLGHRGDGIADTPEGAIYVPYTLPGESVTVNVLTQTPLATLRPSLQVRSVADVLSKQSFTKTR